MNRVKTMSPTNDALNEVKKKQLTLIDVMGEEERQDHFFQVFLSQLIDVSYSLADQGALFEQTCKRVLETAQFFKYYVNRVWLWKDFPGNKGLHDLGIDLVVLDNSDSFWAIQCKFYDQNASISKGDIDSFLSAGAMTFNYEGINSSFTTLYIMSTTRKISGNAEAVMKDHIPAVIFFGPEDFKNCGIKWETFKRETPESLTSTEKKTLFPHQIKARDQVLDGFLTNDRGRMIMACGTGKTFTALKIVEQYVLQRGLTSPKILYLVPSIALLAQTVLEWKSQFALPQGNNMFAICSDPTAADRKRTNDLDEMEVDLTNIPIPATTNAEYLCEQYQRYQKDKKVHFFFSTYQSIDVIRELQQRINIDFDLIICDEAHRTFGAHKEGERQSDFTKVHSNDFIKAKKRLYMTATEKVYSPGAKKAAGDLGYSVLFSMDDVDVYGPRFHYLSFGEAVSKNLLSDYKLIVLQVKESQMLSFMNPNSPVDLDTTARIMGSLAALSKKTLDNNQLDFEDDPQPMKRAVVFTSTIQAAMDIAKAYNEIPEGEYLGSEYIVERNLIFPEADYITGKDNSNIKKAKLDILRDPSIAENHCRILTNARCLSEGVDVPTLDAVVFMARKRAQIDIVQAVGRVMRKPKGSTKKRGYIILPVVIKDEKLTDAVLSNNEDFKVVWQVLQALRSHDERLENEINKIEHTHKLPSCVILANTFFPPRNSGEQGPKLPRPTYDPDNYPDFEQFSLPLSPEDLKRNEELFGAATVKRVGNRLYWEDWSKEIGDVTNAVAMKIDYIVRGEHANEQASHEFSVFKKGLNDILNPVISDDDAVAMLAEHLVTLPVFTAIFENDDFVSKNTITRIMSNMLSKLSDAGLDQETAKLQDYYESVKETVRGITDSAQRQSLVKKIYETFFKYALPKAQEKFGIVYTPNEIVDFIINSVEHVLNTEFKESLSTPGVKILDPFTGTGTFIVRLLDLLHTKGVEIDRLEQKYIHDIWCNEIMLLAYYIALINIEATFSTFKGAFVPFEHAVFTDTFQMAERNIKGFHQYSQASEYDDFRPAFEKQKEEDETEIRVIIANPPYSVGQKNANDNNQNNAYENLDKRIRSTYLKDVKVNNVNSVFDSYVRSFRWASDRVTDNGILAYVTNGSFIDNLAFSGFRKSLLDEFQNVYVFNLRGNARTQGELRRKEKDSVFGQGTRTTICITVLVKHKGKPNDGYVHYHDIGDYLDREKKLAIIKNYGDISAIKWDKIHPDKSSDWLNKKNDKFSDFLLIGNKKSDEVAIFKEHYSAGLKTGKDSWLYNFDINVLKNKIKSFLDVYKSEQLRLYNIIISSKKSDEKVALLTEMILKNKSFIKWDSDLIGKLSSNISILSNELRWTTSLYRPFVKTNLAYCTQLIQRNYMWPSIFPENDLGNHVIALTGIGDTGIFSALISNTIVDLSCVGAHCQCFPLYWYEEKKQSGQIDLFATEETHQKFEKKYAITDETLKLFRDQYENKSVTKEDIFYYIYGVFHSPTYKANYRSNLSKEFPRIPFLSDFESYSKIGRQLAFLHLNYESLEPYSSVQIVATKEDYTIDKIRFVDKVTKDAIIFNDWIRIENIPSKAYEYLVNGRSPIEWVLDQYQFSVDSETEIVNDPNNYSEKKGKYIFDLLLSLITMSIKSVELIGTLPEYIEL